MKKVGREELRERARRSFFADFRGPADAVLVCGGTSCMLAGARRHADAVLRGRPRREVHCLGHCHRSPAWLEPDGRVSCGASVDTGSEVRCSAALPVVTERLGRGDFSDLGRAREAGVYRALEAALRERPQAVLDTVEASGERGRGGAGFPTGRKWRSCAGHPGPERVVVANGDEGDPGSFVDRLLMERDPHAVLEGMALCAWAVGARKGIAYVRSEYPEARHRLEEAARAARDAGLLGDAVLGSAFAFDVEVASGAGSYVCGEETALLESLEGRRGEVRPRPPYPVESGLHGRPTVVNNVESLVNVPWIVAHGVAAYRGLGSPAAPGTKAVCLSAGFARPGVVEVEFGTGLRHVIEELGGGGRGGAPLAGVVLGGPMGSVLLPDEWDVPLDPAQLAGRGIQLGHGGLVALPEGVDWGELLVHWLTFMADESCGRCVPCRLGSRRALDGARRLHRGSSAAELRALLHLMRDASLCGFGQLLPVPAERLLDLAAGGRAEP